MTQRLVYGTSAIFFLLTTFLVDALVAQRAVAIPGPLGDLLERGSAVPLLFVVALVWGASELIRLLRVKGVRVPPIFTRVMIAAFVLSPWLSAAGWLGSSPSQVEGLYWQVVWLIVTAVGCATLLILRGATEGTLRDWSATFLVVIYLGFLPAFGLQLRCDRDVASRDGPWLLLLIMLIIKSSDIGAFFAGKALGRHKLAPRISPGKSVEGAIGGLVASAAVAVAFAVFGSDWEAATATYEYEGIGLGAFGRALSSGDSSTLWSVGFSAVIFGLIMSASGQVGDLIESCFKRDAGIKDSGTLVPTFGGILDLSDSPILALPVAWFLLSAVWVGG